MSQFDKDCRSLIDKLRQIAASGCDLYHDEREALREAAGRLADSSPSAIGDTKRCSECGALENDAGTSCGAANCPYPAKSSLSHDAATPRTDALTETNPTWQQWRDFARQLEREIAVERAARAENYRMAVAARSATVAQEYICKCGIRVSPHRCADSTEF